MIPYSRTKLSDFFTLSQSKNHTLHSGTYQYTYIQTCQPPKDKKCQFLKLELAKVV